jgi:hypothetical protein
VVLSIDLVRAPAGSIGSRIGQIEAAYAIRYRCGASEGHAGSLAPRTAAAVADILERANRVSKLDGQAVAVTEDIITSDVN